MLPQVCAPTVYRGSAGAANRCTALRLASDGAMGFKNLGWRQEGYQSGSEPESGTCLPILASYAIMITAIANTIVF